jgi:hypothetical protein
MALRTLAKPPKNFFEVSKSLISKSSSKLAPAQNALSPSDFSKIILLLLWLLQLKWFALIFLKFHLAKNCFSVFQK